MREKVVRALNAAADLLLPRKCIVCGRKLLPDEKHLCLHCLADLPLTRFWMMRENPMSDRFNALIQNMLESQWNDSERERQSERYIYASALFYYDSEADYRHIPYQIKYHSNLAAGHFFGDMLGQNLTQASWFQDVDTVIPVPLHWRRKWKRGYNQAEIIASDAASALGAELRTDILVRRRSTTTQTRLEIKQKEANVSGAFGISKDHKGINDIRHILLVDDVFTSGSTALACFTALRSAFPPSVRISVATLAFVPL